MHISRGWISRLCPPLLLRAVHSALASAIVVASACGGDDVVDETPPDAAQDGAPPADAGSSDVRADLQVADGADQEDGYDVRGEISSDAPPVGSLVAVYDFERVDNLGVDSV